MGDNYPHWVNITCTILINRKVTVIVLIYGTLQIYRVSTVYCQCIYASRASIFLVNWPRPLITILILWYHDRICWVYTCLLVRIQIIYTACCSIKLSLTFIILIIFLFVDVSRRLALISSVSSGICGIWTLGISIINLSWLTQFSNLFARWNNP